MGFKIVNKSKTITINKRLKKLIRSAAKRDISVDLNVGHYSDLLNLGCIYCGKDLHSESGYCIDRYDNSKGYTLENSSPCCGTCNRSKGSMSHWEFIDYIERAYKFQQEKIKEFGRLISDKELKKLHNKLKNRSSYKNASPVVLNGSR